MDIAAGSRPVAGVDDSSAAESGREPVSGMKGAGTVGEPYDMGNKMGMPNLPLPSPQHGTILLFLLSSFLSISL